MRTKGFLRAGVLSTLLSSGLVSTGCSPMNHTETGATVGGLGGAGFGAAVGAATGRPVAGAVIGGLAGATGGALIGNTVDRDEQHARDVQQAQAVAAAQAQAQAQRAMGIADVIQMTRAGQSEQIIINQIHNTGSTFQLTQSDLNMLKDNGVSDAVISAMQAARPGTVVVRPQPAPGTTVIYDASGVPVYAPGPAIVVAPRPYYYGGPYYGYGYRRW
jgi:uncharacterized protein YcfJ